MKLTKRDKRALILGGSLIGILLLYTFAISPLLSGGAGGASELDAERTLLAKYKTSIAMQEIYQNALAENRKEGVDITKRLLSGSTTALAAAELSNLIRSYAEQSNVYINRENVNPAKEAGKHQKVSLQLSITSDVIGLRDFLALLHTSEKLLDVENLQVTSRMTRNRKPSRYTGRGRIAPFMSEEPTEMELNITMVASGYIMPKSSAGAGRQAPAGALGERPVKPERARPGSMEKMPAEIIEKAGRPGLTEKAVPGTMEKARPESALKEVPESGEEKKVE